MEIALEFYDGGHDHGRRILSLALYTSRETISCSRFASYKLPNFWPILPIFLAFQSLVRPCCKKKTE
jgi:hypothetical protein